MQGYSVIYLIRYFGRHWIRYSGRRRDMNFSSLGRKTPPLRDVLYIIGVPTVTSIPSSLLGYGSLLFLCIWWYFWFWLWFTRNPSSLFIPDKSRLINLLGNRAFSEFRQAETDKKKYNINIAEIESDHTLHEWNFQSQLCHNLGAVLLPSSYLTFHCP